MKSPRTHGRAWRGRGRKAALWGGLLCTLAPWVAVAGPEGAVPQAEAVERAERWTGTYRHVGGETDAQARSHAIERATDDMMFIARSIARGRLQDETEPYDTIRIRVTPTEVTIHTDVRWTTPIDGSPRRLEDAGGDAYSVATHFEKEHLVQTIRDDMLHNVNTFRLSSDGERMRMRVRIAHARIPDHVDYALQYRKLGP